MGYCYVRMQSAHLIFPHQLYSEPPIANKQVPVYLIEYGLYFTQYKFHKQKLVLHRATMQFYAQYLTKRGYHVNYIAFNNPAAKLQTLMAQLAGQGLKHLHCAEVVDYLLERRLKRYTAQHGIALHFSVSPNFVRSSNDNKAYFANNRYFLTDYYISIRKDLKVMLDGGKPVGGKWTYDAENRKKMPAGTIVPNLPGLSENSYVKEARQYIKAHFNDNYGQVEHFPYPTTFAEAGEWLDNFLQYRFSHFGIYQDAIVRGQNWLFHSVLTASLNIGLLSPMQVIDRAIDSATKNNVPVNSLEGFVRQVLGWREYVRAVYEAKGVQERKRNFWNHTTAMPAALWNGTTGLPPVDDAIKRLLQTGYNHHIERLMVLGNFMLLCGYHPNQVYQWFMEMYIDSYDWVMVPNVYGMSQYADGGLMSTKPYISGSSYILKMSNYSKGDWCAVWDALFWNFIHTHHAVFAKNPRMSMMAVQVNKMDKTRLSTHLKTAETFLTALNG